MVERHGNSWSRPLEYLLLGEEEFRREFVRRHAECGNRHRRGEFLDAVQEAGFEVLGQETREEFTPNYLADFLPRLRNHGHPRYRDLPIDLRQPSQIRILLQKR